MGIDYQGRVRCFQLANGESLQNDGNGLVAMPAWPDGYGQLPRHPWRFPDYLETPRLLFDKKRGRPARDLEAQDGFWYVSRAMKELLERVEPDACEFRKCDTVWVSGEPGPEYWLCSVTRLLYGWDVIDFEASRGLTQQATPNGLPRYDSVFVTDVRFTAELANFPHLFRVIGLGGHVFCDQFMKDACRAADLKGIVFGKMAD
ncbi:hypothetical protein B1812_04125 [Methylocystis bryophila]|uniref:Immunity MXAN-0049 protein domain-containing protein n=2 Tax=Methylocystis bryophila TaxID=655015 RepID=A0A1W6MS12_9HYPH|nr:hypothetical protein B1812_04125 [Methylocystis bryophila]